LAFSLLVVGALIYVGFTAFNPAGTGKKPGIAGHTQSESQLHLCAEGKPSTYGNPPTQAQQSACISALADQAAGGSGVPAPLPTTTTQPGTPTPTSLGSTTHPDYTSTTNPAFPGAP
jgi:hypothetical protein